MTNNNETAPVEVEWTVEDDLKASEAREAALRERIQDLETTMINVLFDGQNSGLKDHARRELDLAGLLDPSSDYNGMIGEAVLDLVSVFSHQGHSGFSGAFTLDIFNRVANYGTLTDNDHSFNHDVSEYQNNPPRTTPSIESPSHKWFSDDGGETWYNVDDTLTRRTEDR